MGAGPRLAWRNHVPGGVEETVGEAAGRSGQGWLVRPAPWQRAGGTPVARGLLPGSKYHGGTEQRSWQGPACPDPLQAGSAQGCVLLGFDHLQEWSLHKQLHLGVWFGCWLGFGVFVLFFFFLMLKWNFLCFMPFVLSVGTTEPLRRSLHLLYSILLIRPHPMPPSLSVPVHSASLIPQMPQPLGHLFGIL